LQCGKAKIPFHGFSIAFLLETFKKQTKVSELINKYSRRTAGCNIFVQTIAQICAMVLFFKCNKPLPQKSTLQIYYKP